MESLLIGHTLIYWHVKLEWNPGMELVWEKPNAKDLIETGNLMIFINREFFEYHTKRQLRIKIQSLQLDKEMNALTELKMKGTLVNLPFLNYLSSQDIFKNVLFTDKLISFGYKMGRRCYRVTLPYQNGMVLIQDVRLMDMTLKAWRACLTAAKSSRKTTRPGITKFAKSFALS